MDIIIEENGVYKIDNVSWDDANRIRLSLKKVSELIEKADYDGKYHEQEAQQMKAKIDKIVECFSNSIPQGVAKGIEDDILEFI